MRPQRQTRFRALIFSDGTNYTGGTWPGTAMQRDADSGYYRFSCTSASDGMMIIFSNSGSPQTADLVFNNHGIYNAGGFTGRYYNSGVESVTVAGAPAIRVIEGRLVIDSPCGGTLTVARPDGTTVTLTCGAGITTHSLPHGIYIVNGAKIAL